MTQGQPSTPDGAANGPAGADGRGRRPDAGLLPFAAGEIALLVCDWNGTLVDDAERSWAALVAALGAVAPGHPPPDLETFLARFAIPLADFLTRLEVPGPVIEATITVWNRELAERPAPLAPGVPALLAAARAAGVPVGVVSSAATAAVERDAVRLGIRAEFAFLHGGVGSKTALLRDLAAGAGGPMLYLGDTEHDMEAAGAAGAIPVGYAGGYRPAAALRAAGARLVVADLGELAALLGDWTTEIGR